MDLGTCKKKVIKEDGRYLIYYTFSEVCSEGNCDSSAVETGNLIEHSISQASTGTMGRKGGG